MRLTAGCEATVVRGLRWQARRLARAEDEARDRGLERCSVLAEKAVMTLHPALSRLQDTETLVLVNCARHDGRLFTDDAFANHFGVDSLANRVVNEPAASKKLRRHRTNVLDAHEISEDIVALRGLRMIAEINWSHSNANSVCLAIEEAAGGHELELSLARTKIKLQLNKSQLELCS